MAVTELYIVRHGETEWNTLNLIQGQQDNSLTAKGEWEANALGLRLAEYTFDAVYSSDLGRAVQTAEIIDSFLQTGYHLQTGLRELNFGDFQGMTWAEATKEYPQISQAFRKPGGDSPAPNGESWRQFSERSVTAVREIVANHPGSKVLVISHGGVIGMLLREVLSIPITAPRGYEVSNTALNLFIVNNGQWMLQTMNETSHIDYHSGDDTYC